MIKSNLLARVRRKLYENTPDLWSNTDLYDFINEEIDSLFSKNIYKEELYTLNTVVDQINYSFPSNALKVEMVEFNEGTTLVPDWEEQRGWTVYGDVLYLESAPTEIKPMRWRIRTSYSNVSSLGDSATIDIPDSKVEVVVAGAVLRAYQSLMGYFVDLKNWDYNAKPDGITMQQVQGWIRDVKQEYLDVVKSLRKVPIPRFIDLV